MTTDPTTPTDTETPLTTQQAASRLGVSVRLVREMCASGEIQAVNVGRGTRPRWRIPRQALQRFLENGGVPRGTKGYFASNSVS